MEVAAAAAAAAAACCSFDPLISWREEQKNTRELHARDKERERERNRRSEQNCILFRIPPLTFDLFVSSRVLSAPVLLSN